VLPVKETNLTRSSSAIRALDFNKNLIKIKNKSVIKKAFSYPTSAPPQIIEQIPPGKLFFSSTEAIILNKLIC